MTMRRVFITGGAHGIGRSIVEAFTERGDRVSFCDIDTTLGQTVAEATGATFYAVDVTDQQALEGCLESIVAREGDLDIIINNVGVGNFKPLTEVTVEEFDQVISTNLRSAFITSRFMARLRAAQGEALNPFGRIVNLCSTRYLMSEPGTEGYSASKGGIWSLTHALAVSLAPYRVTVNCIAPGWIHVNEQEVLRPEDHDFHLSRRVGRPEDIARTCLFLCEEQSDFINGQCITVDGGVTKTMIYPE